MARLRPPDDYPSAGRLPDGLSSDQQQQPAQLHGASSFAPHLEHWSAESLDAGRTPPPPPPEPPGTTTAQQQRAPAAEDDTAADSSSGLPSTSVRVHALIGHGLAAAGVLARAGAVLAKQAVRSFQSMAGITADEAELLGLGVGLLAGLGCLCCLRCACRCPSRRGGGELSRGQRARRALSGMSGGRARGRHRALPLDDYDDDDFDDEDDYGPYGR